MLKRVQSAWQPRVAAAVAATASAPVAGMMCRPQVAIRHYNAAYGTRIRSHSEVVTAFAPAASAEDPAGEQALAALRCKDGAEFVERVMPLLDRVEKRLLEWKLAKWEFRIPPLLAPAEKAAARRQLQMVRGRMLEFLTQRREDEADFRAIAAAIGQPDMTEAELRTKPRSWVEKQITQLRWDGDMLAARQLRDAWTRLEQRGGPTRDLLERLSLVYAIGRLGTFDDAFANTVVPASSKVTAGEISQTGQGFSSLKAVTKPAIARLDTTNVLNDLMQMILVNVPTIAILHDFVGFSQGEVLTPDATPGYRDALGTYMSTSIAQQLGLADGTDAGAADERTVVNRLGHRVPKAFADLANATPLEASKSLVRVAGKNKKGERVALFDYRIRPELDSAERRERPLPPCDFAFVRGSDVTLVTIASQNRYVRENQIVSGRQAKGIARRAAMVLGNDLNAGRCRTLLLPPSFVDRDNLRRLHRVLGVDGDIEADDATAARLTGVVEAELPTVPTNCAGWVRFYTKALTTAEEDYAAQSRKANEEEWVRL